MEKIKFKLLILAISVSVLLVFGYRNNGSVSYYGLTYDVGSVFVPKNYSTYGLFESVDKELGKSVSEKRSGSLVVVVLSGGMTVATAYSLCKDRVFQNLVVSIIRKWI